MKHRCVCVCVLILTECEASCLCLVAQTPVSAMTKFSRVIHLLPLLWPLLVFVTIFTPYLIAVSLDHVYPFLPSISKTAAFEPEGSIFGVLLTFVAFSGLVAIFCRYLQLDGIQEDFKKGTLQKVKRLNKVSLPLGVSCILGVVIVANFRSPLGEVSLLGVL